MKPNSPWICYPIQPNSCSQCGKQLSARCIPCRNAECHEEYCSRECREKAVASYHSALCGNKAFQGIELEFFSRMRKSADPSERNRLLGLLLCFRIFGIACDKKCVPAALPQIQTLTGRLTIEPRNVETLFSAYDRVTKALSVRTSVCFEEFVSVIARIQANCFADATAIRYNVPRSLFNHSCSPNVAEHDGAMVATSSINENEGSVHFVLPGAEPNAIFRCAALNLRGEILFVRANTVECSFDPRE